MEGRESCGVEEARTHCAAFSASHSKTAGSRAIRWWESKPESHHAANPSLLSRGNDHHSGGSAQEHRTGSAHGRDNAQRLRGLILLLQPTVLRIGDGCAAHGSARGREAAALHPKNRHSRSLPPPDFIVRELDAVPKMSDQYWFWTGNGKLQTAVADWQGRLAALFSERVSKRKSKPRQMDLPGMKLLNPTESKPRARVKDGHAA